MALCCRRRELALEISVDQGKPDELAGGESRDGMTVELASKAGLTDAAGGAFGADGEAVDKFLAHDRAQVVVVDM